MTHHLSYLFVIRTYLLTRLRNLVTDSLPSLTNSPEVQYYTVIMCLFLSNYSVRYIHTENSSTRVESRLPIVLLSLIS